MPTGRILVALDEGDGAGRGKAADFRARMKASFAFAGAPL